MEQIVLMINFSSLITSIMFIYKVFIPMWIFYYEIHYFLEYTLAEEPM